MASHRDTFVTKSALRKYLQVTENELKNCSHALSQVNARNQKLETENVKLRTLKTELEGQVQVQSTLVTTARVAGQESHKGFAAMKVEYQRAYDRAQALQAEVYDIRHDLENAMDREKDLLNERPWCLKVKEWFSALFNV